MTPLRPLLAAALLAVLLVAAGCAGPRETAAPDAALPAAFPSHTASQIQHLVTPAADSLQAFTSSARLSINSPQQRGSFSAKLRHRRGDSLFVSISPGLGIEAARVLVTPDSFYVYNRLERSLTYGSRAFAEEHLPAALTAEDLFANLLGYLAPPPQADLDVAADDRYYYLTDAGSRHTYVVDPAVWRVVRYEVRDPQGDLLEVRTFEDFEPMGGVLLPRRLTFEQPQQESTASLYYRDVDFNPESLSFALDVNSSAQRKKLD